VSCILEFCYGLWICDILVFIRLGENERDLIWYWKFVFEFKSFLSFGNGKVLDNNI
jgi:hypothetical protein